LEIVIKMVEWTLCNWQMVLQVIAMEMEFWIDAIYFLRRFATILRDFSVQVA